MVIMVGLAGPKVSAKAVADGKTVNIQSPQYKYSVNWMYSLIELRMLLVNALEKLIHFK